MDYDSLNPYTSLEVITSESPQGLVEELKKIKTPIKVIAIVQVGSKAAAYITGDIRKRQLKKKEEKPLNIEVK